MSVKLTIIVIHNEPTSSCHWPISRLPLFCQDILSIDEKLQTPMSPGQRCSCICYGIERVHNLAFEQRRDTRSLFCYFLWNGYKLSIGACSYSRASSLVVPNHAPPLLQLHTELWPCLCRICGRQFGPYLPWALEIWGKLLLVREDRSGRVSFPVKWTVHN